MSAPNFWCLPSAVCTKGYSYRVRTLYYLLLAVLVFLARGEDESLFDFTVRDAQGSAVALRKYAESSKVQIVTNVASNCGYTYTNYRELQKLYEKYQPHGLEILGFPSNQFGEQEPGSAEVIQTFVKNYGVTFPVYDKIEVNGPGSIDLFRFLREKTGGMAINWNFNKFLLVDGVPVKRYLPNVNPLKMEDDIKKLLGIEPDL